MDVFVRQLKELTNPSSKEGPTASDHCKRVAVKLLRRFQYGTRGTLELRYLLEDLLQSLPDPVADASTGTPATKDPYKELRAFAELITSDNGIDLPLKAKPKRPASIDAAGLVDNTKRSKVDGSSEGTSLQTELANLQLLYDLFNGLSRYSASSTSSLSISQLLSQALSAESAEGGGSNTTLVTNGASGSRGQPLNTSRLKQSIEALLPPLLRGQTLRDRVDDSFSKAPLSGTITSDAPNKPLVDFLEGITDILARLCAPIRDEQVKAIKEAISSCREYLSLGADRVKLEEAVENAKNQVQKLVDDMQHDLHLFKLGITVATTNEEELRAAIKQEAMDRERKIITRLYGNPLDRTRLWMQNIAPSIKAPKSDGMQRSDLVSCLVEAMFKPQPLTIQVRSPSNAPSASIGIATTQDLNVVPPIFHLATKHLFVSQNRLQAFTILATLNTIVPSSLQNQTTNASSASVAIATSTWSERVWTLLNSDMLDDDGNTTSVDGNASHVKIANLADEIVRVINEGRSEKSSSAGRGLDEENIRSSVDRMLRLEDRVFALLHSRLKNALVEALRSTDGVKRNEIQVKGFNLPPLPVEMGITVRQLRGMIDWAFESWKL